MVFAFTAENIGLLWECGWGVGYETTRLYNWIINNREVIMTSCIFQWPHPTPDVHAPTLARMHTVQCLTYELLQHAKLSSTRTAENSILFKARSEASL